MFHLVFLALLGVSVYFASTPAWADLPSLMSDKPASAPTARGAATEVRTEGRLGRLLGIQSPLKGKLSFYSAGDMTYRFSRSALKASLSRGTLRFETSIGYSGNRRLEMYWRTGGGRLKFAVGNDDDFHGYRLEFTRNF